MKMKIAISSAGKDLSSTLDKRFGRAVGFVIYDTESGEFTYVDNNQNLNAAQGAGIQAGQNVVETGAKVLITGHCGPKAFRVLKQAGIEIYNAEAETVAQAIELYKSGKLENALQADVEGHWI